MAFSTGSQQTSGLGKPVAILCTRRERKGETQVQSMLQQAADESAVVNKYRPIKASNGVEDKTGMT